ncbi:hypothetical protein [Parasphingorhabdus pacifica]
MTYDLYVLPVDPDRHWRDVLGEQVSGGDHPEWPPAELSDDELSNWDRIVARVRSEVAPPIAECLPDRATLSVEGPDVTLSYSHERVAVRIPLGYADVTALRALYRGYTIARIVAAETDALAVDPSTGRQLPALPVEAAEPEQARLAS